MSDTRSRMQNRLLASMPAAELARIMPSLEHVDLRLGEILHEAGGPQMYFYFPGTCIVSLLGELNNGDSAELSLIGREGGVGLALVLGGGTTTTRATVQSAGTALRWSPCCVTSSWCSRRCTRCRPRPPARCIASLVLHHDGSRRLSL